MTTERSIHETVWALYKSFAAPDTLMFHIPNGEKRSRLVARRLFRMGVVAGAPDFVVIAAGKVFFLELKRPGGVLSKVQKWFASIASKNNFSVHVAHSVGEAAQILQTNGALRADVRFN